AVEWSEQVVRYVTVVVASDSCIHHFFLHLPITYIPLTRILDQGLLSQSLTASSIAPLRSPFLPPSLTTAANRSRCSILSESTTYIRPKDYLATPYIRKAGYKLIYLATYVDAVVMMCSMEAAFVIQPWIATRTITDYCRLCKRAQLGGY